MKKEQKAHDDAQAEAARRAADLDAARRKLAATSPDDARAWLDADADVRRCEAAAAIAARAAATTSAALAAAQRTALERELALVEARLAPSVLDGRVAAVRQRASAAAAEFFGAMIDLARALDGQHAAVAEAHRLAAELGETREHKPVEKDALVYALAEQLREDYAQLRTPKDLVRGHEGVALNLVSARFLFPGGQPADEGA